jgi:hypothetical protein
MIYALFMQGKTLNFITRHLTAQSILSPGGAEKWSVSTVQSILRNEKYSGQAILQKTFCTDFLSKRMKKNEGEIPQYLVENSHPAIVSPEQFDLVQAELERRQTAGTLRQSGVSPFSSRLICESCGAYLGPKVWHSTTPYRRVIWRCNHKYSNGSVCETRHVTEDEVKSAFVKAFNSLISDRSVLLEEHEILMGELTDTAALEQRIAKADEECEVVAELIRKAVDENARAALDPEAYEIRYSALVARYETAKAEGDEAALEKRSRELRRARAAAFFAEVERRASVLAEYDEELWCCTVESVTVLVGGGFKFCFRDGANVAVN